MEQCSVVVKCFTCKPKIEQQVWVQTCHPRQERSQNLHFCKCLHFAKHNFISPYPPPTPNKKEKEKPFLNNICFIYLRRNQLTIGWSLDIGLRVNLTWTFVTVQLKYVGTDAQIFWTKDTMSPALSSALMFVWIRSISCFAVFKKPLCGAGMQKIP